MPYKTILLELVDDTQNEARIGCARNLAQRFGAELVGIHVSPPPFVPVGYGEGAAYVGPEIFEAQREANRLVRERVEAQFRRLCDAKTMPLRDVYLEGDPGTVIGDTARTADVTIASQSSLGGVDALAPQPIDQIILGAGGPVLMLPRGGWEDPFYKRILVAWNGSREASRALKDGVPFLKLAEEVIVFAGGEDALETSGDAVAQLKRHDVAVREERAEEIHGHHGPMLLDAAKKAGATMLVMGAYGHSRLREIVLGGATREILRASTIPVLFSC
ncbi:MAG: universal stress protein [Geminicoccaceae bacterium]